MLLWLFIGSYIIYKDSFYCQSIVSAIRVIYTQSGKFYYRYLHRFFTISLIIRLCFVTACGNSYMKSISITYKSFHKQILYFGLPGVLWIYFSNFIIFYLQVGILNTMLTNIPTWSLSWYYLLSITPFREQSCLLQLELLVFPDYAIFSNHDCGYANLSKCAGVFKHLSLYHFSLNVITNRQTSRYLVGLTHCFARNKNPILYIFIELVYPEILMILRGL